MAGPSRDADSLYLRRAIALSERARASGRHPFAALVVAPSGEVLAAAENRAIGPDCDATGHAELEAVRAASRLHSPETLAAATLYSSAEPCAMCAGAIQHARIRRLVFGAYDPKTGACGSVVDLMHEPRLNFHCEVAGGVLARECGELLSGFFAQRRRPTTPERDATGD